MKKRQKKGDYGYFKQKRRDEILKTAVMFVISLCLFFVGCNAGGQTAVVLKIVAVLGMLPASESAVSMIMYIRYHGCDSQLYEKLFPLISRLPHAKAAYDLVFTTYKVNYEVPSVVVQNGNVYGVCERKNCDLEQLNKHITEILAQNSLKANVKIFDNPDTYINRLKQLESLATDKELKDEKILHILHRISL